MTRTDFPDVMMLAGALALLAAVIALHALVVNTGSVWKALAPVQNTATATLFGLVPTKRTTSLNKIIIIRLRVQSFGAT